MRPDDPRKLRLCDIGPRDVLTVQCPCGHFARFGYGELQSKHRLPSDTLVYDLQHRLRCRRPRCPYRRGVRVLLWDGEPMPSRSGHDIGHHVVIVEGDVHERIRV